VKIARKPDVVADPDAALGTRERIVRTTSRLLQRQGYEGTGIKQVARDAGAALGSLYHFFPGGKQELAAAAIRHSAQQFADTLRITLDSEEDAAEAVIACTRILATDLRDSDWMDTCSFTATALETAGRAPAVEQAIAEALEHWQELLSGNLHRAGIAEQDARDLACTVINTLEGAALACRISRSDKPLELAGTHLARLITSYR
jgi:AcrR family transcriptional regulator